ncbi:unnamed protein product [Spodoptera exigua]|nr:unnamed protein product [Spodoptera exigua]
MSSMNVQAQCVLTCKSGHYHGVEPPGSHVSTTLSLMQHGVTCINNNTRVTTNAFFFLETMSSMNVQAQCVLTCKSGHYHGVEPPGSHVSTTLSLMQHGVTCINNNTRVTTNAFFFLETMSSMNVQAQCVLTCKSGHYHGVEPPGSHVSTTLSLMQHGVTCINNNTRVTTNAFFFLETMSSMNVHAQCVLTCKSGHYHGVEPPGSHVSTALSLMQHGIT